MGTAHQKMEPHRDKLQRGIDIYHQLPAEFNIAGFFHYGPHGALLIHYEELADWFDAKAEAEAESHHLKPQAVVEPPIHRDNLRDALWAVCIGAFILGVLWLAGCRVEMSTPTQYVMPRCNPTTKVNGQTLKVWAMYVFNDSCMCSYTEDGSDGEVRAETECVR